MNRSRRVLKWVGLGLGGLLLLLIVVAGGLVVAGSIQYGKRYDIPVAAVPIPTDAAALARGEHIAKAISLCTDCHGENLEGKIYFEAPGMVSIPTPNLTSGAGGVGSFYTDEDWVRAIRHGVGHDGRALMVMPSQTFHNLSDEDLGAVIAYVKSMPPVDNVLPARRLEPLGRAMIGLGIFPPSAVDQIDPTAPIPAAPEMGVTAAHGEYLAAACKECHGANLSGKPFGPPGQEVLTPNLTPGGDLGSWSEEDFLTALHTGVTPSGRQLSEDMPWRAFGQMNDEELESIWLYLQSLPAPAQGG